MTLPAAAGGHFDAEASERAQSRAVAWLFGFQPGTWAQSWAHFLKSCPYSARLLPSRQRRLSDFAKQISAGQVIQRIKAQASQPPIHQPKPFGHARP